MISTRNMGLKPVFTGKPENIALGKQAIKDVQAYRLHSNTSLDCFDIPKAEKNPHTKHHVCVLQEMSKKIAKAITELLRDGKKEEVGVDGYQNDFDVSRKKTYKAFLKDVRDRCKELRIGNCHEMAYLAQGYIREKGYNADVVGMRVNELLNFNNFHDEKSHVFVLVGLNDKASLTSSSTWNRDEAVIVCPWSGEVYDIDEGLDAFKKIFDIKENERMIFYDENFEDKINEKFRNYGKPPAYDAMEGMPPLKNT